MPTRTCLDCGTLTRNGSRCPRCTSAKKKLRNQDTARCAATVAAWRAQHGDWCPGDNTHPPHPTTDLTADHITPISQGGAGGPLRVLCRAANSRRGDNTGG